MMPPVVYERFVRGYTEKQWGVPAAKPSTLLCAGGSRCDLATIGD